MHVQAKSLSTMPNSQINCHQEFSDNRTIKIKEKLDKLERPFWEYPPQ